MGDNNLPVKVNNNLIDRARQNQYKIKEIAKKVGKVALWTGITGVGVITTPFSLPLGAGIISVGTIRAYLNATSRNSSDLMFSSKKVKQNNSIRFSQDRLRPDVASKMIGYTPYEIGSMMALQTLIGIEKYKRELVGSGKVESDDRKTGIYSQKFELFTHGINIKNMETLEKLGYIKIDKNEPRVKKNIFGKEKVDETYLIAEKIGFGNFKDVKDLAKAALKGDKETLENQKRIMHNIEFRLTDKSIDFEELYNLANSKDNNPAKRLAGIFNKKRGLLAKRKLDIQYDSYGMPKIIYRAKQSFSKRMEQQIQKEQPIQQETLKERISVREEFTDEMQQQIADQVMHKENNEIETEKERE